MPPMNGSYDKKLNGGSEAYDPTQGSQASGPASGTSTSFVNPSSFSTSASTTGSQGSNDVSKDEVGWYFVEQYYTTLSRNPEKLHVC